MDKQQARNLISETFETTFDKTRFTSFIKNLLNQIEETPTTVYRGNLIPDAYEQYISSLERIGKYTDGEHKIDILVVKLKKETSIERGRTMQRNFIAWYLNGSRGGVMKDAALAAFVSPNNEDWRFSLVKMDYRFEEGKGGRVKVKEEFTPARRWSFLVGKNENSHTAQSTLVPLMADDCHNPMLGELEQAFNIEKVTKEFFEKYRELFLLTKEKLDALLATDKKVKADFESKDVNTVDFAKKLLGQIVFLYFLQKKGWFGVGRESSWGAGSKQFLRELFEGNPGRYQNFFNDILEPLFYEALRIDRSHDDDYYSRFNCKIPFLNGGLFDPINNYDWVHTDILLSNELFSNTYKTKEGDIGKGILDIFDRYNFTVKEDEPLEKEVAVDPEMLGKVFENLLEVKDRKSKGTYYTPREIVHYMCRQSLINYLSACHAQAGLATECVRADGNPPISREDIETLVKHGEQVGENEARVEGAGRETNTYFYKLPESIRQHAHLIDEKLANIKVCDPAIGSGAFPVGMMSEIVKTRNVLTTYITTRCNKGLQPLVAGSDRTIYNFKRQCIEKSLYGVDINPSAVEIAKLRLWLSLVVDEDDIREIKPLPNLDYKIVCGNSLLGYSYKPQGLKEIEKLKADFFSETNPKKKQLVKNEIDAAIYNLYKNTEKNLGYKVNFDFRINFSELFHDGNDGFDVVIANPPYVRANNMDKAERKYWQKSGDFQCITGKFDIYILFLEKAINLLQEHGILAFIIPYPMLSQNYAMLIRKFILNKCCIESIYDLSEMKVFDATVATCVIILCREMKENNRAKNVISTRKSKGNFEEIICWSLPQNVFEKTYLNMYRLRAKIEADKISEKIWQVSKPFSDYCYIGIGIDAHDSKRGTDKSARIFNMPRGSHFKPYVEGKEIGRYFSPKWHRYLEYIPEKMHRPKYPEMFETEKILVQVVVGREGIIATLDRENLFAEQTLSLCIPKYVLASTGNKDTEATYEQIKLSKDHNLSYLLGLLCSNLLNWYFQIWLSDDLHVVPDNLRQLPICQIDFANSNDIVKHDNIVKLVNQILTAKHSDPNADTSALERQIDEIVYKLYGLTPEEIAIVEGRK